MTAKLVRKAKAVDTAPEPQAPIRASRMGLSAPRANLDPLILALTRALDRQAPARPPAQRDTSAD